MSSGGARVIVLGGRGAWPAAGDACTGHLVQHGGFQLVVDLGYATLPRLLEWTAPERVDAALFSHGHPDHGVDLHPLLRSRALRERPAAALPVFSQRASGPRVLRRADRRRRAGPRHRPHLTRPGPPVS